jgi:hypothetical protein
MHDPIHTFPQAARLMRQAVSPAAAARDEFWGAMPADDSEYRGRYALDDGRPGRFPPPRLCALANIGVPHRNTFVE